MQQAKLTLPNLFFFKPCQDRAATMQLASNERPDFQVKAPVWDVQVQFDRVLQQVGLWKANQLA